MVILRARNDNNTIVDLDIFEADNPIRLDISAIENATIGDVFGISSQEFSLPGTDKNNQFFGNLFDLGATPAVALKDSIDCQVLVDGSAVFTGKLYITDIITDQKGYTTYQVALVNETIDFKFKLTDIQMSELDWTKYSHSYTYGNITASWDENLLSGSVIYPHVNYGIPEGNEDLPEYALAADTTSRTFDNSFYPLQIEQFKPAIKLRDVVDTIFSGSNELFPSSSLNYYYTSSFFESDYFNSLYVLATPSDNLGATTGNPTSGSFWAYANASQNFNATNIDYKVNFHAENFDTYNRFDLTGDYYQAYANGYYDFSIGIGFSILNYDINNRCRFAVRLLESGSGANVRSKLYVDPPQSGQLYVPFPNVYLTTNKKIYVNIEFITDDGTEVIYLGTGQDVTYFKGVGPAAVVGGNVDFSNIWPPDLRALDFLDGLIQKFNLVVEPVPNETNLLRIEPFEDWINAGSQKDWSAKVDHSQRYKIVHPITEQPKFIEFRDEDDEAVNNAYTLSNFGEVFGTYFYSNDSDLCQGTRTIGKTFAATPVKGIPNGEDMVIPHLGRRDDSGRVRPFKFKPRILHKNGKKLLPITATGTSPSPTSTCYNYRAINNSGINNLNISFNTCAGSPTSSVVPPDSTLYVCSPARPTQSGPSNQYSITNMGPCPTDPTGSIFPGYYWFEDEYGTLHQEQYYYQMTNFEYLPTDASGSINGSRDLHFGNMRNPGWYQYFQNIQNGRTTRDAFYEYWATYINSLYDIDARKLTCNIYLEPWEIQDIALNDKIFIDGHYYRINRINGANLIYPQSVEVELIKIINANLKYPRRRVRTAGGSPVDISIGDIGTNGSVTYVNTNTGATIVDAGVLNQAAPKDGFQVFPTTSTGSIVTWTATNGNTNFNTQAQVFGSNNVDSQTNTLLVAGGNNNIGGQTANTLVVGENNDIQAGTKNTIALGKGHNTTPSTSNVQFLGGSNNYVGGFTSDSTLVGGTQNEVSASSLVTIVGGSNNEVRNSITSRNVTLGGLNNVSDNNQDTVIINNNGQTFVSGSGHIVIGRTIGSGHTDLNDHRNGSNLLGDTYFEGAYFYHLNTFTASSGGSLDLQGYPYSYAWLGSWSGVSGTYMVYLPPISGSANQKVNDGRAMRFKVDASVLSSSYRVRIVPASTDTGVTIDGSSNFDMRGPWDAISLVAYNNNWYILQSRG